jgi:putative ABC transport system ATP-binding protein
VVTLNDKTALTMKDVDFAWRSGTSFGMTIADFGVAVGERVLLLGASGSGKSTLLSLICGINAPHTGGIAVDGTDIATLSAARRDRFRAERIGIIFQQFNLLPYLTPLDNILLPLRFAPDRRRRAGNARTAALTLTTALGLPQDSVTRATADTLSVGQQQRVAVARALIGAPPLIVADEPTSSLDAGSQAAFLDLLFTQCAAAGSTLLMVSHDERLAARFDRSVTIADIATLNDKVRS